jgi:hypothetical protein
VTNNSPSTRAVFKARHCQGGGVTWTAILYVLARRMSRVAPVFKATPQWNGDLFTLNGERRFGGARTSVMGPLAPCGIVET